MAPHHPREEVHRHLRLRRRGGRPGRALHEVHVVAGAGDGRRAPALGRGFRYDGLIDAAFWRAEREIIAGSATPAEIRSSYSPVSALKPTLPPWSLTLISLSTHRRPPWRQFGGPVPRGPGAASRRIRRIFPTYFVKRPALQERPRCASEELLRYPPRETLRARRPGLHKVFRWCPPPRPRRSVPARL